MKYILLFLLVFWTTTLYPAETKKQAKHPRSQRQTAPHYETEPFDVSRETLPPNYMGHDIATVARRLLKVESSLQKSDYETTDAFKARQAAASAMPLVGTVRASDPIAFVDTPHQKYYADANELDIWVDLSSQFKEDKDGVLIRVRRANIGTYQGANAFGAERTVSMSDMYTYWLAMPPALSRFRVHKHPSENGFGEEERDAILLRFTASSAQALKLRDSVRVLFVVRLEPPYVYHRDSFTTPTLDSPYLDTTHEHVLYAHLIALWFFDSRTGAILEKVSISP